MPSLSYDPLMVSGNILPATALNSYGLNPALRTQIARFRMPRSPEKAIRPTTRPALAHTRSGGEPTEFKSWAVGREILVAVSPLAVEAALEDAQRKIRADGDVRQATKRDLEQASYEPNGWLLGNLSCDRTSPSGMDEQVASRPQVDKESLLRLAHDLASAWNAPGAKTRTKQRLTGY